MLPIPLWSPPEYPPFPARGSFASICKQWSDWEKWLLNRDLDRWVDKVTVLGFPAVG